MAMIYSASAVHQRVTYLRWALPVFLGSLAIFYEVGPGHSLLEASIPAYISLDLVFYGLGIPLVAFATLTLLERWLNAKEAAEQQARLTEQRLMSIMTASAHAIVGVDKAGCIDAWNHGAELLFDLPADDAAGRPFASLFGAGGSGPVECEWLMQTVRQSGLVRGQEVTCYDAHGRELALEITASHLVGDGGESLGMAVILRDITERRQRDREIRRLNASLNAQVMEQTRALAEKIDELARTNRELRELDQTRTEFVSIISHQLRAPLTNMRGATERMQHDCGALTGTCTRMFVILEQQIGRLDRLVKDVLNMTRIEAGELVIEPEPLSLLPVVEQVIEQTRARSANRSIQIQHNPGLPLIFADRDRVAEVLTNLLDNAVKYSPAGAAISISLYADDSEVTVAVRDHGVGLRQQDMDRVFDKFYRADSSDSQSVYGYGLGLYVCRQLVVAQHGRIWADNAMDGGAVFSFALPVAH